MFRYSQKIYSTTTKFNEPIPSLEDCWKGTTGSIAKKLKKRRRSSSNISRKKMFYLNLKIQTKPNSLDFKRTKPTGICHMSEISSNLYLGDIDAASNYGLLKEKGIEVIVNFSQTKLKPPTSFLFQYHHLPLVDSSEENISLFFHRFYEIIENGINKNQRILVNCRCGISRAPTMLMSYLMKKKRLSFENCFQFVKDKRPLVSPNISFLFALKEYEKELRKCNILDSKICL